MLKVEANFLSDWLNERVLTEEEPHQKQQREKKERDREGKKTEGTVGYLIHERRLLPVSFGIRRHGRH